MDSASSVVFYRSGNPAEGATVSVSFTAIDPDGAITLSSLIWQISDDGMSGWIDIPGAFLPSYTIPSDQSFVGKYLRTAVTTIDELGGTTTSTTDWGVIANVNDEPIEFVSNINGIATEDQVLTASASVLSDVDGLPNSMVFSYQWQRSSDGTTWSDVSGATNASYTLGDTDVGYRYRVITRYTDAMGTVESTTSSATDAVIGVNDSPSGQILIPVLISNPAPEFQVNTYTPNDQQNPSITWLPDGGWFITWQSNINGVVYIRGMRFNSEGGNSGEFGVSSGSSNYVTPSVATLADGGWVVMWAADGNFKIYGRHYSSAGEIVNNYEISSSGSKNPSVTGLENGGWVVTWTRTDGMSYDIYSQLYSSSGVPIGNVLKVNTYATRDQMAPSVTALADGGWVVVWESDLQDGTGYGIYGQRYNSSGLPIGGEFRVNTYTNSSQRAPSVTALVDGGWLVAWESDLQDGSNYGIYGQRYNSSGMTVDSEFQINTTTSRFQLDASAAGLADGGWLVTWESMLSDGTYNIYAQRYNASGVKVGGEFLVNTQQSGNQTNPSVTSLVDGGWVITWGSTNGSDANIYGQRYDKYGNAAYTYTQIRTIREDNTLLADASQITDPDGMGAISWQWQRSLDGGTTWINISGATESSYTISDADVGQLVRLKGTFIDGQGFSNTIYSATGGPIPNTNDVPIGFTVSISGTATEDQVLTAVASLTSDADGVPNPMVFSYQWQRSSNGTTWTDVAGATASSYSLGDADVGYKYRVVVRYTDGQGTVESTTSSATLAVGGVEDEATGALSVTGTAEEGGSLTASLSGASDLDGAITGTAYQWQISSDGTTWTDISGATSATYNLASDQSQVGKFVRVVVTTTDVLGGTTTFTGDSSAAISNVDDESTATLSVTGTPIEGGSLTASLTGAVDMDGAILGTSYQWQISANGTVWSDLIGATSATYDLASDQSQVGQFVRVVVTTTDVLGGTTAYSGIGGGVSAVRISNAEDEATGTLSVTGTTEEGGSLTASLTGVSDPDGAITGTAYQWQISSDSTNWSNISGATAATYNLASDQSQVGKFVRVVVTTTDALGGTTTFTGDSSVAITNVDEESTASLSVTGVAQEGGSLTASLSGASDPDGAITGTDYQWQISSDGLSWTNISGATSATYNLATDQSQVGQFVRVEVTTTDALGGTTAFIGDSSAAIANVNDNPVGYIANVSGAATEDQILTASAAVVSDADGLADPVVFSYQWQRSSDGSTWTDVAGATGSTYALGDADVGLQFRVIARYTDGQGTVESTISTGTGAVANVNDSPVGGVTLSGQANERQTLSAVTAGLSDPDGLGSFSYQWQSSTDGVLWSALSSATGSTYTLTTADIGSQVRVVVSYTDAFGATETVISSPSAVVAELVVNEVSGTSGADTLTGLPGVVNVYTGGGGNDSITGKDRADVAVFTGNRSDYTVTTVAGVITVVDNRPGSPDGTDTLRGMNILRFADSQLFVTAAANRTTLAGVAQTFEVANSEFVTGTAAAERFIIESGVSAFVSAGTGDTVDLSGAITDYTYKASGNQLQISDGVNTTVLTVGGAFTLRTASGSTPVVLDFAAGGVIKLGAQVVGSAGFDPAAAITNAGNVSDNAIPEAVGDVTSNELVIAEPLAPMGLSAMAVSMSTSDGSRATPSILPIADTDQLQKMPVIAMPVQDELERLLGAGIDEFIQNPGSGPSYGGFPGLAEDPFARQIMDIEWPAYPVLPQEVHAALVI